MTSEELQRFEEVCAERDKLQARVKQLETGMAELKQLIIDFMRTQLCRRPQQSQRSRTRVADELEGLTDYLTRTFL